MNRQESHNLIMKAVAKLEAREKTNQLKTIKKGTRLITKHLGTPVRATSMESIKQGRGFKKILLVDVKGSDIGLFDEIGSIYVDDIVEVLA